MENPVIAIAVEDSNSTPFIPNNPRGAVCSLCYFCVTGGFGAWLLFSGLHTMKKFESFFKNILSILAMMIYHLSSDEIFGCRCHPTTFPPEAHAEIQRLTQELKAHKEELNRRAQQEQHMQDRLDRLDREAEERRAMMNEQFRIEMDEHRRQMDEQRRQMDEQRRQMDEYFRQMASSKNAPNDQTNSTDDEASDESDSEDADD
ncbi:hypothetical protein P8452_54366 [Trifolium repens]|nr:hypothetical protein P8452_54366 [Trifolium repens]